MIANKSLSAVQQFTKFKMRLFIRPKTNLATEKWEPVYRLPIIHWAAAFNKLKIYQTAVTILGIPFSHALQLASYLPEGSSLTFSAIGITGCIALTLPSLLTKNLVGIIYMNDVADKVKLAYIDFWGKRRNTEIPIEEIIIPHEMTKLSGFYQSVKTTTGNVEYKLLYRFGNVINSDKFSSIFGE